MFVDKKKKELEDKLNEKAMMRQEDNEANIARYNAQLEYKKQLKLENGTKTKKS